ncbi:TPA: hypothetical protein N0F65_010219 [Lagenidium giganteum]|uniref:Sphingomyelin synthase-like domain-containing protein n=1 Tax=Lagenidium giganteum TaxID=4803 RepID=A0AAV2YYA3_9STRA|nr:TPA: hypothetical protein N0F65_010219 [Lagenidium giganteum]
MVTVQQHSARRLFLSVTALLLLLVGYTSFRFPHKYVRVTGSCESNWLKLDDTPKDALEVVCCDGINRATPCYSGIDIMPVLSSLQGAWLIPMVPLVANYVCVMLGPNTTMPRIRPLVRRALMYIALMAFRTFVLFMGFGAVEDRIMHLLLGSTMPSTCEYAHLRRHNKCAEHFDHSDHIVLLVTHFLAVTLFEWFALSVEIPTPWYTSVKKTFLRLLLLAVGAVAAYMLFFTASHFHSPWENVVAMLIAQMFGMLPMYLLSQDRFAAYKYLQLKHFVRPPTDVKSKAP